MPPQTAETTLRHQSQIIGHAALVMIVALLGGFALMFALLGEIAVWPVPWAADVDMPGSARGWRAAHIGGLLNGVMMIGVALCLPVVGMAARREKWVAWAMIFTGWANTIFYLFGNLASNRGLSGGSNALGEGSFAGLVAYVPAVLASVITISALAMVAASALKRT